VSVAVAAGALDPEPAGILIRMPHLRQATDLPRALLGTTRIVLHRRFGHIKRIESAAIGYPLRQKGMVTNGIIDP